MSERRDWRDVNGGISAAAEELLVSPAEVERYYCDPRFHAAVLLVARHADVHLTVALRMVVGVEELLRA